MGRSTGAREPKKLFVYSLRVVSIVGQTDVSSTKIRLDTFVSATTNSLIWNEGYSSRIIFALSVFLKSLSNIVTLNLVKI